MVDQTGQPYVYACDNPLNATDPLGLGPIAAGGNTNADTLVVARAWAYGNAIAVARDASIQAPIAVAAAKGAASATTATTVAAFAAAAINASNAASQDASLVSEYLLQAANIQHNLFAPPPFITAIQWNKYVGPAQASAAVAYNAAVSASTSAANFGSIGLDTLVGIVVNTVAGCGLAAGAVIVFSGSVALAGGPVPVAIACLAGGLGANGAH